LVLKFANDGDWELQILVQRISERIGRHLERKGLLVRDVQSSHLAFDPDDEDRALTELRGHSIAYRIAIGPHPGVNLTRYYGVFARITACERGSCRSSAGAAQPMQQGRGRAVPKHAAMTWAQSLKRFFGIAYEIRDCLNDCSIE
jgi:hypothetical protein